MLEIHNNKLSYYSARTLTLIDFLINRITNYFKKAKNNSMIPAFISYGNSAKLDVSKKPKLYLF